MRPRTAGYKGAGGRPAMLAATEAEYGAKAMDLTSEQVHWLGGGAFIAVITLLIAHRAGLVRKRLPQAQHNEDRLAGLCGCLDAASCGLSGNALDVGSGAQLS